MSNERVKRFKERLECVLTPEELQGKGNELAEQSQTKQRLEEEKKAIVSDFKAKADSCDSRIGVLALAISTRREYRQVECELKYNNPEPGFKTIRRLDTNTIIKSEPMTDDEKADLFINALGEDKENGVFVFLDRKSLLIIYTVADRVNLESEGWMLSQTANDREMVRHVLEDGFDYQLYKNGVAFSLYKKAQLKMVGGETDDSQKEATDRPDTITAENGIVARCEYFDDEAMADQRRDELLKTGFELHCKPTQVSQYPHQALLQGTFDDEEYIVLIVNDDNWAIYWRSKKQDNKPVAETPATPASEPAAEPVVTKKTTKGGKKTADKE